MIDDMLAACDFDPEGKRTDYWRLGRAMFAAGFRKGELIHNTFSDHFTPAGFMADHGAQAIGCAVFPGGVGQTEMQVAAMAALKPQCYVGTPSFLRIILEKADELKAEVSSVKKALVSAEALPPSLRAWFERRGISTLQCYAIGDLGLLAYESPALASKIAATIREVCNLRGEVAFKPAGSLPNDGKVIDDVRRYD
jgi:phenylacetate-CoA ligase